MECLFHPIRVGVVERGELATTAAGDRCRSSQVCL